jgi:FMN phosphatase YigB (HAD superfamily)
VRRPESRDRDNARVIEAVTFDFWNTIARVPPGAMTAARVRAIAAACESCEVELEAELLSRSMDEVAQGWERSWGEGRHLHPRDGAEMLVRALGVEGAARELVAEAFLSAGRDVELELAPGVRACVEALDERGVRLGIVCDVGFSGGEILREALAGEGLLERFSGWGFSDEVGAYKPAPEIFEAALAMLGAPPERAAHVGDLRRTDVAGAAAMGMTSVRYRGLHDDDGPEGGAEAEHVIDSHRELAELLERLG